MDITTILAVACSTAVFLAWFVLPASKPARPEAAAEEQPAPAVGEPVSLSA